MRIPSGLAANEGLCNKNPKQNSIASSGLQRNKAPALRASCVTELTAG
jgi:hypothetical protein